MEAENVKCVHQINITLYWTYAKESNVEKLEVTKVRNLATKNQNKTEKRRFNKQIQIYVKYRIYVCEIEKL